MSHVRKLGANMKLPTRLNIVLKQQGKNLTKLAIENRTQKSVLSETITGKRNTPRLISILETNTGLPIEKIRQIYREDKNRKVPRQEVLFFIQNQGAKYAASHN